MSTIIRSPLRAACRLLVPALLLPLLLTGCQSGDSSQGKPDDLAAPNGATLRLAVVDDPAMAKVIEQLCTEWTGQSGFELTVDQISQADLTSNPAVEADAIVCPSVLLGLLGHKDLILPLPDQLIRSEQSSWSGVFPLLRSRELTWAGKAMAVPFGSPVLTCYYRADLLHKLNRKPPTTWAEYGKLAARLADAHKSEQAAADAKQPWQAAIEPLGPGWAGITLLARAAPYASHRGNYSVLFNVDTMEPLIAGPPFVRALEELVAAAGSGDVPQLKYDPTAVRKAFWEGRCGLALTWPTAADTIAAKPGESFRVGFVAAPGSLDVYNVADKRWEQRRDSEDRRVPLLASSGRLGVVLKTSPYPEAAFQLIMWLSDKQWSQQVSPVSPATTLFRQSHLTAPGIWVEKQIPISQAADYAELTSDTFAGEQQLLVPRIPGCDEYLAALDEAVTQAVRGKQKPQEALTQAADRWREITKRLGLESQRTAYNSSIGLD